MPGTIEAPNSSHRYTTYARVGEALQTASDCALRPDARDITRLSAACRATQRWKRPCPRRCAASPAPTAAGRRRRHSPRRWRTQRSSCERRARRRAATAADVLRRCRRRPRRRRAAAAAAPAAAAAHTRSARTMAPRRTARHWPAHAHQYIRLSLIARGAARAAAMRGGSPSTATCSPGSSSAPWRRSRRWRWSHARLTAPSVATRAGRRRRKWRRSSTLCCGVGCRRRSTGVSCAPLATPTRSCSRCTLVSPRRATASGSALRATPRAVRRRPSCRRNSWRSQRWWARAPPPRPSWRV